MVCYLFYPLAILVEQVFLRIVIETKDNETNKELN